MPSVVVVSGRQAATRASVRAPGLVVGRAAGEGLQLRDESLSRRHARLVITPSGEVVVEDLGSTNGTFVNGVRVAGRTVLRDGDVIRVGNTDLRFSRGERPEPDEQERPGERTVGVGGAVSGSVVVGADVGAAPEHAPVDSAGESDEPWVRRLWSRRKR